MVISHILTYLDGDKKFTEHVHSFFFSLKSVPPLWPRTGQEDTLMLSSAVVLRFHHAVHIETLFLLAAAVKRDC